MEITRLAVVAYRHDHFDAWCAEHGVSPRDKRIVHANHPRKVLNLGYPVPYVLAEWPGEVGAYAALAELRVRGVEVTGDELADFLATLRVPEATGTARSGE